jgi:tight adherence protein B
VTASVLAALLVGLGLALIVSSLLGRLRRRDEELAEVLDLPFGEHDVSVEAVLDRTPLVEGTVNIAGRVIDQLDTRRTLATSLERANIPIRPGEYAAMTVAVALGSAVFLAAITTRWWFGVVGFALAVMASSAWPKMRIRARQRAFSDQLPDALALIAGSLSAGHTFLRSIQMMTEEAEPPMSEEFARVIQETRLGDPVVDALERMAHRLELRDLIWVVQAIRIQQTVGGKLADLLHTLADFMRAREEVRREVMVLTAEGRISAWVLAGLPLFLLVAVQVVSPGYMDPLFSGMGLLLLFATGVSVAIGTAVILRMVKIEV